MLSVDAYREEWGDLDAVAHSVYYGARGSFLTAFASAWMKADVYNKAILKPAWEKLIEKYNLGAEGR